jgi:hypothetical protein
MVQQGQGDDVVVVEVGEEQPQVVPHKPLLEVMEGVLGHVLGDVKVRDLGQDGAAVYSLFLASSLSFRVRNVRVGDLLYGGLVRTKVPEALGALAELRPERDMG